MKPTTIFAQVQSIGAVHGPTGELFARRVQAQPLSLDGAERAAYSSGGLYPHSVVSIDVPQTDTRDLAAGDWIRLDVRPLSPEDRAELDHQRAVRAERLQAGADAGQCPACNCAMGGAAYVLPSIPRAR